MLSEAIHFIHISLDCNEQIYDFEHANVLYVIQCTYSTVWQIMLLLKNIILFVREYLCNSRRFKKKCIHSQRKLRCVMSVVVFCMLGPGFIASSVDKLYVFICWCSSCSLFQIFHLRSSYTDKFPNMLLRSYVCVCVCIRYVKFFPPFPFHITFFAVLKMHSTVSMYGI